MRRCKAEMLKDGKKVPVEGFFHQWAAQCEDFCEYGPGNYTVALVELDDGSIVECIPQTVKFASSSMFEFRKIANRLVELDELCVSILKVSGYTVEQLLQMFMSGYEMKGPEYSGVNNTNEKETKT